MNMSRIIKDALKYPFSDWKKILILGFVILVSDLTLIFYNISHITNNEILIPFIGFLILFFVVGYEFRIIKSSLNGVDELPKFNAWTVMFKEGIKNYIVHFVYLIPVFLIILFYLGITNFLLDLIRDPSTISLFLIYLKEIIIAIVNVNVFTSHLNGWIQLLVIMIYLVIAIPLQFMGIANMAKNDSKLRYAFNFREIFHTITNNGLKNLIILYIAILLPFSILLLLKQILYLGTIYPSPEFIILVLIGSSYSAMYLYRLVALFYLSK